MFPFIIKTRPFGTQKNPLIVTVSKKTAKRAVDRNLIKRRIRAIMRPYLKTPNKDFMIIAKSGIIEVPFSELKKQIEKHLTANI